MSNKALRKRAKNQGPPYGDTGVQIGHELGYVRGYEAAVRDMRKGKCLIRFTPFKPTGHGIEGPTVTRGVPRTHWFDAGYLDNGHCSFMRTVDGASCCGSHGHAGEHHYP